MYGVYTSVIRHKIPNDDSVDMSEFFAYLGVINAIALLPIVVTLHFTQVEDLSGLTWTIAGTIVLNAFFNNVMSDYLWARVVLLTSPTVATLGLGLTVPLAMIADSVNSQVC